MREDRDKGRKISAAVRRRDAFDRARQMLRLIEQARHEGYRTERAIAQWLNEEGSTTAPQGGKWHQGSVGRLLKGSTKGMIELAKAEYCEDLENWRKNQRRLTPEDRKPESLQEPHFAALRDRKIAEAEALGRKLRGERPMPMDDLFQRLDHATDRLNPSLAPTSTL